MIEEKPHFEHAQKQTNEPDIFQVPGSPLDIQGLTQKVNDLERKIEFMIANHTHDGGGAVRINWNADIIGTFETVSAVPTIISKSPFEQIKIYVNGATLRLYWYDVNGGVWYYVTATA